MRAVLDRDNGHRRRLATCGCWMRCPSQRRLAVENQPVPHSTCDRRREAMTSRRTMSVQRRHPRPAEDSASASWSARCHARHPTANPCFERGHALGGCIMKPWLTVDGGAGNTRAAAALTEGQVAEQLGLSVATLRAWRHRGRGPRFLRFGRAVRYLPADLDEFIRVSAVDTRSVSASDGESKAEGLRV